MGVECIASKLQRDSPSFLELVFFLGAVPLLEGRSACGKSSGPNPPPSRPEGSHHLPPICCVRAGTKLVVCLGGLLCTRRASDGLLPGRHRAQDVRPAISRRCVTLLGGPHGVQHRKLRGIGPMHNGTDTFVGGPVADRNGLRLLLRAHTRAMPLVCGCLPDKTLPAAIRVRCQQSSFAHVSFWQ